jgi:hypothetical protein
MASEQDIRDYAGIETDRLKNEGFDGYPSLVRDIDVDEEVNVVEDRTAEEGDSTAPELDFEDLLAPDRFF